MKCSIIRESVKGYFRIAAWFDKVYILFRKILVFWFVEYFPCGKVYSFLDKERQGDALEPAGIL